MRRLAFLLLVVLTAWPADGSPTAEFEAPYAIRLLPGGTVVEIAGSFSWAVPQNLTAMLARAPTIRTVRFDSPGGYVTPALKVAEIIRARGLDTYVARLCASACTMAYLGGNHRYLGPEARLGFHQASMPGIPPAAFDPLVRQAYAKDGVPATFVAKVLSTPPNKVWFPTLIELRQAGFMTGPPPDSVAQADDSVARAWFQAAGQLSAANDAAVVTFTKTEILLLADIQAADPEACWGFLHDVPIDLRDKVQPQTMTAMTAAEERIHTDTAPSHASGTDFHERRGLLAGLARSVRLNGDGPMLAALAPNAAHDRFCPAFRTLLLAALAQPAETRMQVLRALLPGN